MEKEHIICFIDDSAFEHDLVRKEVAPAAPDLLFVQAYTFAEAETALKGRTPGLFLLDLWGQDASVTVPEFTPKAALEARIGRMPALDTVYDGLEEFQGDKANEYLKRMFAIVGAWRELFEDVCARVGQNRKYGLSNLDRARRRYPGVPAVFYTRKSLISDAVALFQAGADGLYLKPTGADDVETRRLTRDFAPELIGELRRFLA
jgi:DNA-binding NarL/FixJ family response regulator